MTAADCRPPRDDSDTCSTFTSVASATYDTANPAVVTVGEIRFEGWNEWGFWLSNGFNTFEATTTPAVYTDGTRGLITVEGQLRAGTERYDGPAR